MGKRIFQWIFITLFSCSALFLTTSMIDAKEKQMVYIHVNDTTLTMKPANNSSARAFIKLLKKKDLTIEMEDYNDFEKVGEIGSELPRNDKEITTKAGDVILYQGDKVTIYYDENTYNFTKLGHIHISQKKLKQILGEDEVTVTFSLKKEI